MPVTFEPHVRLEHLENYVRNVHLNLPLEEARVQLLRCRLVGYSILAELKEEGYTKKYIDQLYWDILFTENHPPIASTFEPLSNH